MILGPLGQKWVCAVGVERSTLHRCGITWLTKPFFHSSIGSWRELHLELTLLKISWVKWEVALNSKVRGGLDIGSLKVFNTEFLLKCRWRFFKDLNSLWSNVIRSIYGIHGGLRLPIHRPKGGWVWLSLVKLIHSFHENNIIPHYFLKKQIGNERHTRFWDEVRLGGEILMVRFPRS